MIIEKNTISYELKGSPHYLGRNTEWMYFPAQFLLIKWNDCSRFSDHYDEETYVLIK
jgi:hypothetical protein